MTYAKYSKMKYKKILDKIQNKIKKSDNKKRVKHNINNGRQTY